MKKSLKIFGISLTIILWLAVLVYGVYNFSGVAYARDPEASELFVFGQRVVTETFTTLASTSTNPYFITEIRHFGTTGNSLYCDGLLIGSTQSSGVLSTSFDTPIRCFGSLHHKPFGGGSTYIGVSGYEMSDTDFDEQSAGGGGGGDVSLDGATIYTVPNDPILLLAFGFFLFFFVFFGFINYFKRK